MRITTDGLGLPRETFARVLHFQILLPPSAAAPSAMEGSRGLFRVAMENYHMLVTAWNHRYMYMYTTYAHTRLCCFRNGMGWKLTASS
jgi:hypothetical protein